MNSNRSDGRHRAFLLSVTILLGCLVLLSACSDRNPKPSDHRAYLGEYAYDAPITAMVYEDFEGEGYGIVYREITDFTGYVTKAPSPILIYFYTSLHDDYAGTTAEVEQIAEDYHADLLVMTVDVFQEGTIAAHYGIETVPEFILFRNGAVYLRFESGSRETWSQDEFRQWVIDGIT